MTEFLRRAYLYLQVIAHVRDVVEFLLSPRAPLRAMQSLQDVASHINRHICSLEEAMIYEWSVIFWSEVPSVGGSVGAVAAVGVVSFQYLVRLSLFDKPFRLSIVANVIQPLSIVFNNLVEFLRGGHPQHYMKALVRFSLCLTSIPVWLETGHAEKTNRIDQKYFSDSLTTGAKAAHFCEADLRHRDNVLICGQLAFLFSAVHTVTGLLYTYFTMDYHGRARLSWAQPQRSKRSWVIQLSLPRGIPDLVGFNLPNSRRPINHQPQNATIIKPTLRCSSFLKLLFQNISRVPPNHCAITNFAMSFSFGDIGGRPDSLRSSAYNLIVLSGALAASSRLQRAPSHWNTKVAMNRAS
ncbi:uncharacterized protein BDR25DRAFT_350099 [Lindgomyces ingoldianus]|uniref:Uncharacterized protein n=1 Tax=Lindgomyces ingoldianus TaxID=673940 RepID=A0ACB6R919_9PLEO|nr:uncharacterized protein BDR25DRAFT_350099 [Lindgomyces ingoldianus]KAF2475818.1 hypothetical protein BDR25DRAFT_350099 [Lindgomyces ingoldianus]